MELTDDEVRFVLGELLIPKKRAEFHARIKEAKPAIEAIKHRCERSLAGIMEDYPSEWILIYFIEDVSKDIEMIRSILEEVLELKNHVENIEKRMTKRKEESEEPQGSDTHPPE